ncbi:MAG: hypothetical protein IKK73_04670 [Akkermansia sp.]|nr:hypothetical protein [Akkermansia sp.]MBR6576406.1 hypothetical protein [Akkermansia sp.]
MSKGNPQKAERRFLHSATRILPRARRCGRKLLHGLISRRVVVSLLVATVALELAVLGVGVTRRLDLAYEHSLEVSRAQLAVIEARELAQMGLDNQGAAGIAAPAEATGNDQESPPPLRVRDVDTILAQENGFDFDTLEAESTQAAPQPPAAEEAAGKLSQEDREELERLIRQGVTAMTAGDMRQCVLCLEEASLLSEEHPAMLYYYGMAYDKLLNPEKAREYYTKVFQMRDRAGNYFKRAAHRLTYGFDQTGIMRGKLSFGPHQLKHTYSPENGEQVSMMLPILLAPGEEVRMDDLYIHVQFFDLVNARRVAFSRGKVEWKWQNDKPDWSNWEENLVVSYSMPPLTQEELQAYGDIKHYGFTAKLYYKGEPLDCISSPSSLILQEQRLNTRQQRQYAQPDSLLPDDGLVPAYEEALPVSDFLPELPLPQ